MNPQRKVKTRKSAPPPSPALVPPTAPALATVENPPQPATELPMQPVLAPAAPTATEPLLYTQSDWQAAWDAGLKEGIERAERLNAAEWHKFESEIRECMDWKIDPALERAFCRANIDYHAMKHTWEILAASKRRHDKTKAEIAALAVKVDEERKRIYPHLVHGEFHNAFLQLFELGRLLGHIESKVPGPSYSELIYAAREKWRCDPNGPSGITLDKSIISQYGDERLKKLNPKNIQNLISIFWRNPLSERRRPRTPGDRAWASFYDPNRGVKPARLKI